MTRSESRERLARAVLQGKAKARLRAQRLKREGAGCYPCRQPLYDEALCIAIEKAYRDGGAAAKAGHL